ncbi:MAG: hypothetical protein WC203_04015 [Candidatus Bathyarchaeia archaeon]
MRTNGMNKKRINKTKVVLTVLLVILISTTIYITYITVFMPQTEPPHDEGLTGKRAVIVDQLSLNHPNQTFVNLNMKTLQDYGYTVDYIPGEKVTVEFFRNLPTYNYKIIILRVHVAESIEMQQTAFFTNEEYSESKYIVEQMSQTLGVAKYPDSNLSDDTTYFAISPRFIQNSMIGEFNDTAIIMMGCFSLKYPKMAEALITKGANVCVGWNETVSATHTDYATSVLIEHLIVNNESISQAVYNTMTEVGIDPNYYSSLKYYPQEAKDTTLKTNY